MLLFEQHLQQIFINHETKIVLGVNLNLHSCTRYFVILQSSANATAPLLRSLCNGIALSSCTHGMAVRRKQSALTPAGLFCRLHMQIPPPPFQN